MYIISYLLFSHECTYENTKWEVITPSPEWPGENSPPCDSTIADWFSFCGEVILDSMSRDDATPLGGPGVVVEIDETKVGRRKYNRGRLVEGQWVLGFIEQRGPVGNHRARLVPLPNNRRDADTLCRLITEHVSPDSTLFTDCWKGYANLNALGFEHFCVNHTYEFVTEDGVSTQNIESLWRAMKRKLQRGGRQDLARELAFFSWRRAHKGGDMFTAFLEDVRRLYPGV